MATHNIYAWFKKSSHISHLKSMLNISFSVLFSATLLATILFLVLPLQKRWIGLLAGSILFYAFLTGYQIITAFLFSLIIYTGTLQIKKEQATNGTGKTTTLLFILLSLLPLLFVKLLPWLPSLTAMLPEIPPEYRAFHSTVFEITGVSFFTFNGISYLIDVRKKYIQPERNYFLVLLYILFFPVILAGPLQRAGSLFTQFKEQLHLSNDNFSRGFRLVLWGVFKNFVIAQECYYFMNSIQTSNPGGLYVLLQGFSFFFYLYFNFSSYVDIFTGIARIFNVQLNRNFGNRVYASTSRKQFWEQWHITLNNWFRDYFFFAVAKKVKSRVVFNIALISTFILIGIWHGFSWRFAIWGLINGIWILLEQKLTPVFASLPNKAKQVGGLFYHWFFASVIALLFSANDPLSSYRALFSATTINETAKSPLLYHAIIIVALIIPFHDISRKMGNHTIDVYIGSLSATVRWLLYLLLAFCILSFTVSWSIQNYYFQF